MRTETIPIGAIENGGDQLPDPHVTYHFIFRDYPYTHVHTYWEIPIVIQGAYRNVLNGKSRAMQTHDAVLIHPNDVHELYDEQKPACHLNLMVNIDYLHHLCDAMSPHLFEELEKRQDLYFAVPDWELSEVWRYCALLRPGVAGKGDDVELVDSLLLTTLLRLLITQKGMLQTSHPAWMTDLITQINDPKNAAWRVKDVVKNAPYSHTQLSRLFKEYTGKSLMDYLTEEKMLSAANYLVHSDMAIVDIATALGYSSLPHFNNLFKKRFSTSPSQYRKAHRAPHTGPQS